MDIESYIVVCQVVTITSGYSKVINNGVASGVCVPAARFVFTVY